MDRDFALTLYRALKMITAYLEKRFGFGKQAQPGDYDMLDKSTQESEIVVGLEST
jgi:hypothetical protein